MLFLISMWTFFSGMAGGGAPGKVAGIVHAIITGVGFITAVYQVSILMLTRVGEDTTENATGTDTGGIMNEFPSGGFDKTGRAGAAVDIGKGVILGVSRAISLDRYRKDRN